MRHFTVVSICMLICASGGAFAQERKGLGKPDKDVCKDPNLLRTFEVIEGACDAQHCDENKLGEINQKISKPQLMAALRQLPAVHLFWHKGKSAVSDVLDFAALKKDQLEMLKFLVKDNDDMAVYVIGRGSAIGSAMQNQEIARRRTLAVYEYLTKELKLTCRHVLKAAFGKTVLPLETSDANLLNVEANDYEHNREVLNQSVEVIIFPCRNALPIVKFNEGH